MPSKPSARRPIPRSATAAAVTARPPVGGRPFIAGGLPAACGVVLGLAGTASAVDRNFNVTEGDYTNAANWVDDATGAPSSSAPTSSDNATIGVATPELNPPQGAPDPGVAVGTALVGDGQVANANFITLGRDVGTTGGLRITGTGIVQPRFDLYIGGKGPPTFNGRLQQNGTGFVEQSGGTVTASNMQIGMGANGEGTYTMTGGTLTLNNIATAGGQPVPSILNVGGRALNPSQLTARILDPGIDSLMNQSGGDVLNKDQNPTTAALSVVTIGRTTGDPGTSDPGSGNAAGDNLYAISGTGRLSTPRLFFGNDTTGATVNAGTNTFTMSGNSVVTANAIEYRNLSAANTFNFNGGTLTANTINLARSSGGPAPLVNNGGTLSPGRGGPDLGVAGPVGEGDFTGGLLVGTTAITGTYSQSAAGRTTLDVGSTGNDRVEVGGAATLAGNLTVRNGEGFTPPSQVGNLAQYQVMTFASRSGRFTSYSGRDVNADLTYVPVYSETDLKLVATVPGDATLDGRVNLADFGRLRSGFGQASAAGDFTLGDFDLSGAVNLADFGILRAHFNDTVNSGGAFGPAAISEADWAVLAAFEASVIPEPAAGAALLVLGAGALLGRRRRR